MASATTKIIKRVANLISLPEVYFRVNDMINDPNCTMGQIGKTISQDPALTIRLLKIANSPFYGFSSEIDTVSKAVTVLGTGQIRDLILATSVSNAFANIPNDLITMENFWKHSVFCGLIARIIAFESRKAQAEMVFIAGLLHDIGQLIIYHELPDQARTALNLTMKSSDHLELYQAEREIMGFDHAQLGGELVEHWRLPENLQHCIQYHHAPANSDAHTIEIAIVHIANSLAVLAESDSINIEDAPKIDPIAKNLVGFNDEHVEPTIRGAQAQISEVQSLLSLGQ